MVDENGLLTGAKTGHRRGKAKKLSCKEVTAPVVSGEILKKIIQILNPSKEIENVNRKYRLAEDGKMV